MKWLFFLILMSFVAKAEGLLHVAVSFTGIEPSLLFIWMLYIAIHAEEEQVLPAAWGLGFITDLFFHINFRMGCNTLIFFLTALLVLSARDQLFKKSALIRFLITLLLCFPWMMVKPLVFWFMVSRGGLGVQAYAALLNALGTAALAPLVMAFLDRYPLLYARLKLAGGESPTLYGRLR
jgi:rod shape-determining protein MreD